VLPKQIKNLANALTKLPEIGPRAALRLVFFLLETEQNEILDLSEAIKSLKTVKICPQCFNLSDNGLCILCQDKKRDNRQIMVIETILDILPIERTKQYHGLYHILGGVLSPLDNIGPEKLKIKELITRINNLKKENPSLPVEIIIAFNPTTEGDTTTLYLERQLKPLSISITKLGRGLATGSNLEYADENTIAESLKSRK